jgi:molybdopterin-guanine dinucleotide biosynthesis protein A
MPAPNIAAAIIAGGEGTRLGGVEKAALEVGGRSIAARTVEVARAAFARVVVVANAPGVWSTLGVDVVPDLFRGAGPLAGVHAALIAAPEAEAVVCVGGDLPFVAPALLALLRDHEARASAVVPRVGGKAEPLLARYGRECLPVIEARLRAGQRAAHELFDAVATTWLDEPALRVVDPELRSLLNVNTPEDLAQARALATS